MERVDLEVINDSWRILFLSNALQLKTGFGVNKDESSLKIKANTICFYKYLLSLNKRLSNYKVEQVEELTGNISDVWHSIYFVLKEKFGLDVNDEESNKLEYPYKEFWKKAGLEVRDSNIAEILLGIKSISVEQFKFYEKSNLVKDSIDQYIALSILKYLDIESSDKNLEEQDAEQRRSRRLQKCLGIKIFNKEYRFNNKVYSESLEKVRQGTETQYARMSLDKEKNSLLIHKKMLMSDASFACLHGRNYTSLKELIRASRKLYLNLKKQKVNGKFNLNTEFLLEQVDMQTCALKISLFQKWVSLPNVAHEIKNLLDINNDTLHESIILFFMLLCSLPNHMAFVILDALYNHPAYGFFYKRGTDIYVSHEELDRDMNEALGNIKFLNEVLLLFLVDVFPCIDRIVNTAIKQSKMIDMTKVRKILNMESYGNYKKNLKSLYEQERDQNYYDSEIVQYLDRFVAYPLSGYIQDKQGLNIAMGDASVLGIVESERLNDDSLYNITNRCILEVFLFIYNEYREYIHNANTYKDGRDIHKVGQSPQSFKWLSGAIKRWDITLAEEELRNSIYSWIKGAYKMDDEYEWSWSEDERLVGLLQRTTGLSKFTTGLTKLKYQYNDMKLLEEPMKKVKKKLKAFLKALYSAMNSKDVEAKSVQDFVLNDKFVKSAIQNEQTKFDQDSVFWLYLPHINNGNIVDFLDAIVTCGQYKLRKSYLELYDAIESLLWITGEYIEGRKELDEKSITRLQGTLLDKIICHAVYDRKRYNGKILLAVHKDKLYRPSNPKGSEDLRANDSGDF